MMQGSTVLGLTAQLINAGVPRAELVPVIYCHPSGHFSFHYERDGHRTTVGEIGHAYDDAGKLLDEVKNAIRVMGCPTTKQLYENWKMEDWLVERLRP